jgi:glucan phosphoethanolaminetransferase (alkaline phosphatase superfamily)
MPNDEILIEPQTPEEKLAFEKARFDYCVTIHKAEDKRRKNLESKSRFYLSFITLFLGAVFFNIEFLEKLRDLVAGKTVSATLITGIYACAIILAISLLVSLVSILASVQLKSYKAVYPEDVTQMLFGPNSDYIEKKNLTCLYGTLSMNYTQLP